MFDRLKKAFQFAQYDAVTSGKDQRRRSFGNLKLEDNTLTSARRKILLDSTQDLYRNFSLCRWMVNQHVNNISNFAFHAITGNEDVDKRITELMEWWSQPHNCDVTSRMSLSELMRQAERRRVVDGDVFILKTNKGQLQLIESDRIRSQEDKQATEDTNIVQGVRMSGDGRELAYALHSRTGHGSGWYEFQRWLRYTNCIHYAWRDRVDQVRGISPLASCYNTMQDLYEAVTANLQKAKVAAMFGLFILREPTGSPLGAVNDDSGDSPNKTQDIDMGGGAFMMDMNVGEDVKWLENRSPSNEFQDFIKVTTDLCLKSLLIPYALWNESDSNYSQTRMAIQQYNRNAEPWRSEAQVVLNDITRWRLDWWLREGVLRLPEGMDLQTIKWVWQPKTMLFVDPQKEYEAAQVGIDSGLLSRTEFLKGQGKDWNETFALLSAEEEQLAELRISTQRQMPILVNEEHIDG